MGHTDFFYFPQVSEEDGYALSTDETTLYQAYTSQDDALKRRLAQRAISHDFTWYALLPRWAQYQTETQTKKIATLLHSKETSSKSLLHLVKDSGRRSSQSSQSRSAGYCIK